MVCSIGKYDYHDMFAHALGGNCIWIRPAMSLYSALLILAQT